VTEKKGFFGKSE